MVGEGGMRKTKIYAFPKPFEWEHLHGVSTWLGCFVDTRMEDVGGSTCYLDSGRLSVVRKHMGVQSVQ